MPALAPSALPIAAERRIDAGWIIPIEPAGVVLEQHSLILRDGRLLDILPTAKADQRYTATEHVRLPTHVLIPGLVNLHTHAAMNLLRGYADDLPLMTWLQQHIWPAEAQWVSPEFVHDGTRLACLEMLEAGVTCFNDMYFFPEAAVEAALTARQRIAAGIIVIDFPSAYAGDPDDYLNKGVAMRDAYHDQPLFSACLAPHAPYSCSDKTLEKVATWAAQLDLPVHMHVHETVDEIEQSLKQHGLRPLARLLDLDLLSPQFIAVHTVHLSGSEIALLKAQGVHVAHCPSSNLKLASGIAPIANLIGAGVPIGLGTDGAASNNRLDVLGEMRLAALLAKGQSGRADVLPAQQALAMATLGGAQALGLEKEIGSLVPSKQADIVAIDLSQASCQPGYSPLSQLVYSAGRKEVSHVWVAGQPVVTEGRCQTLDRAEVLQRARHWAKRIRS